jgi:hypothetical protein
LSSPDSRKTWYEYLQFLQINRAVSYALIARTWGILAAPVTAILIAYKFSSEVQGYYYAFNGLLALQVFVELGLGTVTVQFAAHEWSKLHLDQNGFIQGDNESFHKLSGLLRITIAWFSLGGVLLSAALIMIGLYVFESEQTSFWRLPWIFLALLTGLRIALVPMGALLEGCNQVVSLYHFAVWRITVERLLFWFAIISGFELWSTVISAATMLLADVSFYYGKYRHFLRPLIFAKTTELSISWSRDLFPLQWRIALTFLSSYFMNSLFTPILFKYQGPIIAGQFGMTLSIAALITTVSTSWLSPAIPQFGALIAMNRYKQLNTMFDKTSKMVIIAASISGVFLMIGILLLQHMDSHLAERILNPFPAGLLLCAQVLSTITLPYAAYMRAHKKEPLLWATIFFGISTALTTYYFGRYYSVDFVLGAYLIFQGCMVPIIIIIWRKNKRNWRLISVNSG